MTKEEKRPGFIIYYETLDSLEEYTDEEAGSFLRAAAMYTRYGALPDFSDRGLRGLWKRTKNDLDRDDAAYQKKCQFNRYNAYVSAEKRRYRQNNPGMGDAKEGRDYLCREDWIEQIDEANASERIQSQANASESEPTSTPTATSTELQRQQQSQQSSNSNHSLNRGSKHSPKGDMGETVTTDDAAMLQAQFVKAIANNNLTKAGAISNQLFGMGYNIDKNTGELSRR